MAVNKGERIKALREAKDMTQEELAKKLSTSKQTVFKYENNIITNIPSDKIEIMADIFNVSPAYLMGWDEATNEDSDKRTDYYTNELAGQLAQKMYERPGLKILLDSTQDINDNDLQFIIDMVERMKK